MDNTDKELSDVWDGGHSVMTEFMSYLFIFAPILITFMIESEWALKVIAWSLRRRRQTELIFASTDMASCSETSLTGTSVYPWKEMGHSATTCKPTCILLCWYHSIRRLRCKGDHCNSFTQCWISLSCNTHASICLLRWKSTYSPYQQIIHRPTLSLDDEK